MRDTVRVFGIGLFAMASLLVACGPVEPVTSATAALAGTWTHDAAMENCYDLCGFGYENQTCSWDYAHHCNYLSGFPLCPTSVVVGGACDTSTAPGNTGCWKFSSYYATYYYCQ